ncbi:InlB B-repeat-containing protein [Herbivorax sp. ANBcel31]|uniref:InlB B-repeat-containing protein n=1 Tax=Herbivorax sp. ANBcel31 TaxID=3069754 RepID=UPI0027B60289|nr:InlB B-repeat-containing protein [Herbivorax sp. ANBcel31]MDQ2087362.1 InlB B-repeat-containing protein [Herbivorax sp. ANBcel31]
MKGKLARCIVSMGVCVLVFVLSYSVVISCEGVDNCNHEVNGDENQQDVFKEDITLHNDEEISGDLVLEDGTLDLAGNMLTVEGDLIQTGGTLLVNGGYLDVAGDYKIEDDGNSVSALLKMTNKYDYVKVEGSFITKSNKSHSTKLLSGIMEIKGDFIQKEGNSANFLASETHMVILSGDDIQTIEFENLDYSRFNTLGITKPLDEGYNFLNDEVVWNDLVEYYEETEKELLEVSVLGNGSVKMDDEILPLNYKELFEVGTEIELEGIANENSEFAFWEDGESGTILSGNSLHQLVIGTGSNLKAIFFDTSEELEEFNVVFIDRTGKVLQSTKVAKNEAAVPPADPYMIGYEFVEWNQDFENVESNMLIAPIFERLPDKYVVTVSGGELSDEGTEGEYKFDVPVEVIANEPLEGMQFSHWEQDGIKISNKNTFSFFMPNKDTELTAVFVEDVEGIEIESFIALSEYVMVDDTDKSMIFVANRNLEEADRLIESGIILLQSDVELEESLTLETDNIIRGRISNDSTDQFYVRKKDIEDGESWYARSYMIYEDSEGSIKTVYSEVTVNSVME